MLAGLGSRTFCRACASSVMTLLGLHVISNAAFQVEPSNTVRSSGDQETLGENDITPASSWLPYSPVSPDVSQASYLPVSLRLANLQLGDCNFLRKSQDSQMQI